MNSITLIVGKENQFECMTELWCKDDSKRVLVNFARGSYEIPNHRYWGAFNSVFELEGIEKYFLSEVVAALVAPNEDKVYIQCPELGLHPYNQLELGDLAIKVAKTREVVYLTNSEHMILRILRRIRRPSPGLEFSKDRLNIIHAPTGKKLRVDEEGEFIDRWPDGFFSERMEELRFYL